MQVLSKELKAVAVTVDMSEPNTSITRDQCMSVDNFTYRCRRRRDSKGRTYGANEPVELCFNVRLNSADLAQPLYRLLNDNEHGIVSFVFNATFSETKRMNGYDEAMAVEGFIVDIQEEYRGAISASEEEQIILSARMMVRAITYLAQNDNKTLRFIQ